MGTDGAKALVAIGRADRRPSTGLLHPHRGVLRRERVRRVQEGGREQGRDVGQGDHLPGTNFTDATTQVREAAAANPDVIVATGYYPDGLLIANAVAALDPTSRALYGIANGAFDDGSFPAAAGAPARTCCSANYHYAATSDRVTDIRTRFEAKYGGPMETAAMLSYQAVEVIAAGLEDARTRPAKRARSHLRRQLEDPLLAFDGPIKFDETGQNENATVIVMQVRRARSSRSSPTSSRPPTWSSRPARSSRSLS